MRNKQTIITTLIITFITTVLLSMSTPSFAQDWQSLSVEQQTMLKSFKTKWNSMPEQRQTRLSNAAKRWKTLNPKKNYETKAMV